MSSWTDLISDAYAEVGALALGETLNGEKTEEGRRLLNRMLGQWRLQRRLVVYMQDLFFPLVSGKQTYTIGPQSADPLTDPDFIISGTRPVKLERVNLVVGSTSPTRNIPITVIHFEEFAEISVQLFPGDPYQLYYQPSYPNGTMWPWPLMNIDGNLLELFIWQQLNDVPETIVASQVVLADGYADAIVMSLAERLLTLYPGRSTAEDVIRRARESRNIIETHNVPPPRMDTTQAI